VVDSRVARIIASESASFRCNASFARTDSRVTGLVARAAERLLREEADFLIFRHSIRSKRAILSKI
jgi:hypothetical protein